MAREPKTPKNRYAVLGVWTGQVCYVGDNETAAARALKPGTTFGVGRTRAAAVQQATWRRRVHMQNRAVQMIGRPRP